MGHNGVDVFHEALPPEWKKGGSESGMLGTNEPLVSLTSMDRPRLTPVRDEDKTRPPEQGNSFCSSREAGANHGEAEFLRPGYQ